MAIRKRKTPTQADVKMHFVYLDKRFGEHEGRLAPIDICWNGSIEFVKMYMTHIDPGTIRADQNSKNPVRLFNIRGGQHREPKLVWLYHTGKYPQTAIRHKDGNRLNCKIKNLELTNVASALKSSSGVPGVYKMTTGVNAYMWRAVYIENQYEERAVDADGKPLSKEDISWKTRGWHMRKTKIVNTRNQKHIGYYLTKEKAIKALKLYTNEIKHPICRYRTDIKIKRLCLTLKGIYPNDASAAVWHYIQILYNRKAIDEAEALFYMEMLGHDNKVLMLREGD